MGRAQRRENATAVATRNFNTVLGFRRGERSSAVESTAISSDEGTAEITTLLSRLQERAPLLRLTPADEMLLDALANAAADPALSVWHACAATLADTAGIRSIYHSETLLYRRKGITHVWPEGGSFPDPYRGHGKTLCGLDFVLGQRSDWKRAPRSGFTQPPRTQRACARCQKKVVAAPALYPEATEKQIHLLGERSPLPTETNVRLHRQLRTALVLPFTIAINEGATETELEELAKRLAREHYLDALATTAVSRSAHIFHALEIGEVTGIASDLGITDNQNLEREFGSWFDEGDWRKLLDEFMPGTPRAVGVGRDRWRRSLSRSTIELGIARGYESLSA